MEKMVWGITILILFIVGGLTFNYLDVSGRTGGVNVPPHLSRFVINTMYNINREFDRYHSKAQKYPAESYLRDKFSELYDFATKHDLHILYKNTSQKHGYILIVSPKHEFDTTEEIVSVFTLTRDCRYSFNVPPSQFPVLEIVEYELTIDQDFRQID